MRDLARFDSQSEASAAMINVQKIRLALPDLA